MPLPSEVFLSHATPDRKFADRLAGVVRGHGVPVWYSPTNLVAAQQWHDEIGHALARCDAFVVILSPAAVRSQWAKLEYMYALTRRQYRNRIVPLLLKPCDTHRFSWTVDAIQRVDFTGEFDDGCLDLLRVWGLGYTTPAEPAVSRRAQRTRTLGKRRKT